LGFHLWSDMVEPDICRGIDEVILTMLYLMDGCKILKS